MLRTHRQAPPGHALAEGFSDTSPTAVRRLPRSVRVTSGRSLLARYTDPGDFFFGTPRHTLLAQGSGCGLEGTLQGGQLSLRARTLLAREPGRSLLIAGALPFDPRRPATLDIYRDVRVGDALRADEPGARLAKPLARERAPSPRVLSARWLPSSSSYRRAVVELTERIRAHQLDKAVLAQQLELLCDAPVSARGLLSTLAYQNPAAMCFAARAHDGADARSVLVGASPELLVAREGRLFRAHPMAGSIPRSSDPAEDRSRAQSLLASDKDRREHRIVVDEIARALAPLARRMYVPEAPACVATPTMWHLATLIEGELEDPQTHVLDLVGALHPTPAVCGAPPERAFDAITQLEGVERGAFAGAVGYCDGYGDGEWAVAIRCAQLSDKRVRLFAGAGIVAGSVPESEHAEVRAKLKTMRRALGLEDVHFSEEAVP